MKREPEPPSASPLFANKNLLHKKLSITEKIRKIFRIFHALKPSLPFTLLLLHSFPSCVLYAGFFTKNGTKKFSDEKERKVGMKGKKNYTHPHTRTSIVKEGKSEGKEFSFQS
jgi:hypothetical protein